MNIFVDNVVLGVLLPIVLLDVEHIVVVELCKFHSLAVMFCCARCCCRCFPYPLVELLVEIVVTDDVEFAYVLQDVERSTLNVEHLDVHSLGVRSCR